MSEGDLDDFCIQVKVRPDRKTSMKGYGGKRYITRQSFHNHLPNRRRTATYDNAPMMSSISVTVLEPITDVSCSTFASGQCVFFLGNYVKM